MIEAIHTQQGYVDVVAFLNKEFALPTSGLHAPVVSHIKDSIEVIDYWLYVQEVYENPSTYKGAYFVTEDSKLIYLENQQVAFVNTDSGEVQHIFDMESGGLKLFYSDKINLYNTNSGLKDAELQVALSSLYGAQFYYTFLRTGATFDVTGEGIVQSLTVENQILSNYNVRIDKNLFTRITMTAMRNRKTEFTIEVAPKVFEKFTYDKTGEQLFVVDTPMVREQIALLIKNRVISANL